MGERSELVPTGPSERTTTHRIIDVDGHVWEPDELWEQYLPPSFHDRRPRIVHDDRGTTRYAFEGKVIPPGHGPGGVGARGHARGVGAP